MKYPNLLIVTNTDIFQTQSSSSLTIKSYLDGWPREHIYQLICKDFNCDERGALSPNTFVIGHNDIKFCSKIIKSSRVSTKKNVTRLSNQIASTSHSFLSKIKEFCVTSYKFLPYNVSHLLRKFLIDSNIQVIYSCTASYRTFSLCSTLSKRLNIPFVPHFFDDWPNIFCSSSSFLKLHNLYFNLKFHRIVQRSTLSFCISETMCEEYRKRYNSNAFTPLMNSVEDLYVSKYIPGTQKRTLVYGGILNLGRYKTLLQLAEVISSLQMESAFTIDIYTQYEYWSEVKDLFVDYPFVCYQGYVNQQDLLHKITASDGLLFLESFDTSLLKYTRFSMSTKIPEYLSSGIPIIALGNEFQTSIAYLLANNAAYVCTSEDKIRDTILSYASNDDIDIILNNARRLYMLNHVKKTQCLLFYKCICGCLYEL